MSRPYLALSVASTWLLVTACVAAGPTQPTATQQDEVRTIGGIILKPKTAVESGAALMRIVSAHLRNPQRVSYLRAMSGGAHVLQVIPPASKADIPAIIAELNATGLFEYVEEDRMMTIRRPRNTQAD